MKPHKHHTRGRGSIEIIEEAVHLLRMCPGATLGIYYIGTLPFILGLLYFWADMSRNPFAGRHTIEAALAMAGLFIWMKVWQTFFLHSLRAQISALSKPAWTFKQFLRILLVQTIIQPSGLLLLPLALIPAGIPFIWCYAFYQNIAILGDGETDEVKTVLKRALRQTRLWPSENVVLLIILFGFGFFLFLNLTTVTLMLPGLVKMLLGIESVFSQSAFAMLNTTFFAAVFGLTYLCLDPLIKTSYLLRCFYGESMQSGLDLKAELKQFSAPVTSILAGLVLGFSLFATPSIHAHESKPSSEPPGQPAPVSSPVQVQKLDKAIQDVIKQPKYAWRLPRVKVPEDETEARGPIGRFLNDMLRTVKSWAKSVWDWLSDFFDRLFNNRKKHEMGTTGNTNASSLKALLMTLLIAVVAALIIFLVRVFLKRQPASVVINSEAIASAPDLSDENIGAEQLPEDGWIKLGRELMSRGELRLAMRAFYFASLTHLAGRNLITIAKFKSNRDYERELRRRGHSLPDLLSVFSNTVLTFDRTWYGMHEVSVEMVRQFASDVERIKGV